jgi:hypothetical protein
MSEETPEPGKITLTQKITLTYKATIPPDATPLQIASLITALRMKAREDRIKSGSSVTVVDLEVLAPMIPTEAEIEEIVASTTLNPILLEWT